MSLSLILRSSLYALSSRWPPQSKLKKKTNNLNSVPRWGHRSCRMSPAGLTHTKSNNRNHGDQRDVDKHKHPRATNNNNGHDYYIPYRDNDNQLAGFDNSSYTDVDINTGIDTDTDD
ncbi:hypothetical protein L211DRAFT_392187 [Terfezia boudieri ATCC MYA-4762]|uniref:Uncharacterized protein n=1 Tax=Terfezia boudieri ATCC MYA-4762 TaxID=1051890 RepID=A0A3N4M6A6_9PEZI|nr:hypothetical protein L211DRAFT_392187 [Terfezia boudieri ATCC MYA-4762]